tara:strand:+ start:862 stop:1707 length:846 start_codon:yes stop_codon:yes gene_type:complete
MKYFTIDNFVDKKLCSKLIKTSSAHNYSKNKTEIHGGRQFMSSTDIEFYNLLNNTKDWKNLVNKINSEKFLNSCLKKFNLNEKKFSLVNFFKCKNLTSIQKSYKKLSSTVTRLISTKNLVLYSLIRLYRDSLRKLKFSKLFYPNKSAVELLFDYSKAGNGYSREIHRDSDNRLVVFILYLNSPSKTDNHKGGNFDIYKLIKGKKNVPFPDKKNCKKIKSIKPKPGQLIVFLNDNNSFHGVEKMKNHSQSRDFIYGGFTLLNKKNPYIDKNNKVATEFHLYD